ncbi:MAG: HNH endonuclease family protein [Candidatus Microsaccharimonas sp.]
MKFRLRRLITVLISIVGLAIVIFAAAPPIIEQTAPTVEPSVMSGSAREALEMLLIKGRAPKTGYARSEFGSGWATVNGCDTRAIILHRDLQDPIVDEKCTVVSGTLIDSYTGKSIAYSRDDGAAIQIDHVVALSNAWQTGAQQLSREDRVKLANDPLNLIAVDGPANREKGDSDAATWLPSNKGFRCEYVARQIAVKQKYALWVTQPEKEAMVMILGGCPSQSLPAK